MTPKEKAIELVDKYFNTCHKSSDLELSWKVCKQCASIAIDELLESHWNDRECGIGSKVQFYRMVKSEINKL